MNKFAKKMRARRDLAELRRAITGAHLRGHESPAARPLLTRIERDPPLEEAERAWIERVVAAAGAVR